MHRALATVTMVIGQWTSRPSYLFGWSDCAPHQCFFFFFFNGLWNYQYILPVVEIFHDLSLFSALSWRGDFQFDAEENLQPFGHQIQSCRWNPAGKWERGQFPEHQWMNVQHNSSLLQTSFVSICQAIYFTIIDLVLHEYIRKYFISINMF